MPISFVAAGTVATGANPTVTVPAGYASGDLLVIVTCGTATPTTPSGWTSLGAQGANQFVTILYKTAGASEASVALTLAGSTSKAVMVAYRGVGATDKISTFSTATGTTLATNTVTTAAANEYVVSIYAANGGAATTWTAPGSTTSRVNSASTSTLTGLLLVDEAQAAAGTTTARTGTVSASRSLSAVAFTIAPNDQRYWVGGTASWDGTAGSKWSFLSGGTGGASIPTSSIDTFFDANSGANTVTIATGNTGAKTITCTGFTGTFAGTGAITVSGNLTLVAGMTVTYTGTITFNAAATITSAAKTLGDITVNTAGTVTTSGALTAGTLTITGGATVNPGSTLSLSSVVITNGTLNLGGNLTSSGTITLTQGTLNTSASNYSISATDISSSNANARTLSLNGSSVTLSAATPIDFTTKTNLTLNAGTSTITCNANGVTFNGNGLTFYNVSFTSTGTTAVTVTGANTFNNLSITSPAAPSTVAALRDAVFSANQTINGTLTCAGASAVRRIFLLSDTRGTQRTLTANAISATDCDFRDIVIAGSAAGSSPTRAGDCGNNSGITFPAPKTVYWNLGGTAQLYWFSTAWAATNGGAPAVNNFPLPQDTATFTNTSATPSFLGSPQAINVVGYNISSIDASARTSNMNLQVFEAADIYGNLSLGSGFTFGGTVALTFSSSSTKTISSAGLTNGTPIVIAPYNSTVELASNFSTNDTFTVSQGTFDAKNFNFTTSSSFATSGASAKTITMGSGTWTLSGTGTLWTLDASTTINANTSTIAITDTSATARTFNGGGFTYYNFNYGGGSGSNAATLTITGSNTFNTFSSTRQSARTIAFGAGTTNTFSSWAPTNTATRTLTLNSSSAGSPYTLALAGGGFISGVDYVTVRDAIGSPISDTWYIGANSTISTSTPNSGYGMFTTQRTSNVVIVLTSTSSASWTVPNDWNPSSNSINLIGGGGGGGGAADNGTTRSAGSGGGGGGFTKLTNQNLTKGSSITYQCGTAGGGGAANTSGTAGGTTSWNAGASTAGGGNGGGSNGAGSNGGTGGTGSTFNGGRGGNSTLTGSNGGGAGGGGAAGPNGAGANGARGTTATGNGGGGGGGNGGGSAGTVPPADNTGGAGGNNSAGVGGGPQNTGGAVGGGGGGSIGGSSTGSTGIEIFGIGSGGGGGGGDTTQRTNTGGLFGGGGGGGGYPSVSLRTGSNGAQGAIIITYVPYTSGGNFLMVMN